MAARHFSFDDEDEVELPLKTTSDSSYDRKGSNTTKKQNTNGTKKKGKKKIKKWVIVLLVFVLLVAAFIAYVIIAGSNDGPVYGDRCASLLAIDESKFSEIEATIEKNKKVKDLSLQVDCRIVKFQITLEDGTSVKEAKTIAKKALSEFDKAMGYKSYEGSKYSELFNYAQGRGQYNGDFLIISDGKSFPIYGTKHPDRDGISYTTAKAKDKETTKEVLSQDSKENSDNTGGE